MVPILSPLYSAFGLLLYSICTRLIFFCDICSAACTGRLRIMDWEAAGGQGPGAFLKDLYTIVYAWLCGKRWKRPSIVIVPPFAFVESCFSSLLPDTFTITSSSAGSDRTESRPHGQDMYHQEWLLAWFRHVYY
jgi:hypothetical protein